MPRDVTIIPPEKPKRRTNRGHHTRVAPGTLDIELSSPLVRTEPIGTEVAPAESTTDVQRKTSRIGKRYMANAMLRLVELAELDQVTESGELRPLSAGVDRRVVMVAVREYLDRVFGKERIMDPDVLEPTRPKFDPSLYTPEQLEEIERVLRMVQATQGEDDGK